ncbi:MAG: hypothetical protein IPK82_23205 [Polyangiaceae bacterium]|nr:hypothetical protein [Polyangiaceae bacterium]
MRAKKDIAKLTATGQLQVNYCVQRCHTFYVSIHGYGPCCADCSDAPGINSGEGYCSNRCPAAAWAAAPTPRPTPQPPPTPVPVTLSGCSGLCGGCNCGRSCCASMCGGNSLIINHDCVVSDGGQLLVRFVSTQF